MAKYIDATLLKAEFTGNFTDTYSPPLIKTIIDGQPTADVQEVKHGHWIKNSLDNFRKFEYSCSICGWSGVKSYDSYIDIYDFEFCPYCGAKMDEEEQK